MIKNYLVLGATGNIGKSCALSLSKKSKNIIYCIGNNFKKSNPIPNKKNIIKIKFSDFNSKILKKKISFDIIINCIGSVKNNLIKFHDDKIFNEMIKTNLSHPVNLISNLYKFNLIKNRAKIIFINSVNGTTSFRYGSMGYGVAKSAITSAVKFLAKEMASKEITANALSFTMIYSDMVKNAKFLSSEQLKTDEKKHLLYKRFCNMTEVQKIINFFLSSNSNFITGQNIIIDGGYSLNI